MIVLAVAVLADLRPTTVSRCVGYFRVSLSRVVSLAPNGSRVRFGERVDGSSQDSRTRTYRAHGHRIYISETRVSRLSTRDLDSDFRQNARLSSDARGYHRMVLAQERVVECAHRQRGARAFDERSATDERLGNDRNERLAREQSIEAHLGTVWNPEVISPPTRARY